jgi:poly(3-hydroxyalkanoate) depolymerase
VSKTSAPKSDREHRIEVMRVGGRDLRVAVWKAKGGAKAAKRPLLFFNGIGANIEAMSPLADWISDRDIVTYDMPGVGQSPNPLMPYRPWMMALTTAQLLDQLGYDKVDVMGVSWGGGMAQQFAFQNTARVGKVILCATSAGMLMVPGDIKSLSKMADPKRYVDPSFMLKNFQALYGGDGGGADGHVGRITAPSKRGYLYQLAAMAGWTSAWFLPFLKQKVLVLMGDADKIVPLVNGKILKTLIPQARLEVIKGGGHLFLITRAAEVVPVIADFLAEADRDAASREKAA